MESPSSMNFLLSPLEKLIYSFPDQVSSIRLPYSSFFSPLMVPEPNKSPDCILQPVKEWWASCWLQLQYKYLKFVLTIVSWFYILAVFIPTFKFMSKELWFFSWRYCKGFGSCSASLTSAPSSASMVTIQGEIVLNPFLAVNGPKGTYSHTWKSLKLQSFSKTSPKM